MVDETTDSSAAGQWVRWVTSELAWGTCTLGHVVLGYADGLGPTSDGVAGRDTLLTRIAYLLLGTLSMVLALVLRDETATGSVIWVSVVSLQALADALVIGGTALRVGWAVEELTDWPTLERALRVRAAHLVARTLGVGGAGWHGDQLTPPGQRVSQMTRGALTEWPVVLDRADL